MEGHLREECEVQEEACIERERRGRKKGGKEIGKERRKKIRSGNVGINIADISAREEMNEAVKDGTEGERNKETNKLYDSMYTL